MFAGLITSSCSDGGKDDSNIIFVNLLSSMTSFQAKIVDYACRKSTKLQIENIVVAETYVIELKKFCDDLQEHNIDKIDAELDVLCSLQLMPLTKGGIIVQKQDMINITPTPLALRMYIRCQGLRLSPLEFFKDEIVKDAEYARAMRAFVATK